MPSRLFFHAANSTIGGTLPSSEQNTALSPTRNFEAQTVNRSMNTTKGTSVTSLTHASISSTATTTYYVTRFVSTALAAQTIAAQTWTYNFATGESNASANFPVAASNQTVPVTIYVWRPGSGAKVGDIFQGNSSATISEFTAATSQNCTVSGSSIVVQSGDVICIEVIFSTTQGTSASRTLEFYYDGTVEVNSTGTGNSNHASYLQSANDITFILPPTVMDVTNTVVLTNKFITKV